MIAADRAGIPVFVTGGIGGVHRGAQSSKLHIKWNTKKTKLKDQIIAIQNKVIACLQKFVSF